MACVCAANAALPQHLSYQDKAGNPGCAQDAVMQLYAVAQGAVCSIEAAILNTPLGLGQNVGFLQPNANVDFEYKGTQWKDSGGKRFPFTQMLARYPSQKVLGKPLSGTVEYNYAVAQTGRILVTKVRQIP